MVDHDFMGLEIFNNTAAITTVTPKDASPLGAIVLRIAVVDPTMSGTNRNRTPAEALTVRVGTQWKNGLCLGGGFRI